MPLSRKLTQQQNLPVQLKISADHLQYKLPKLSAPRVELRTVHPTIDIENMLHDIQKTIFISLGILIFEAVLWIALR